MDCTINWNNLSLEEWNARFAKIRRANLLQSYEYALAACALNRQTARWGLIYIDGAEAGLVQMLEARALGVLLQALVIDCGPLWFDGFGSKDHVTAFAAALNRNYPRRFGRARRFIPYVKGLEHLPGFKKTAALPYQTIWLDLCREEAALRAALNAKWRNKLRKAEKASLAIEWDDTGLFLPELIAGYIEDKKTKGYEGPSVKLLTQLAKTFAPKKKLLIARALTNNKPCAYILVLCHGSSATYQIGWTTNTGRDTAAHHLLLWDALAKLKDKGIQDFDLGGVNDESAKGVKTFKEGLGGELITLSGLYT